MHQESDSTAVKQQTDRNSLFIEINSQEDAVASRDRAAIAVSLLCIFSLIAAVQFFVQGVNIENMDSTDRGIDQASLFITAGFNVIIVLLLIGVTALIAIKNSRIAVGALLIFAVFDALIFGWGIIFGGGLEPQRLLGVILGSVARFFVVLTALNSMLGVVALQKYQAMKTS